MSAKSSTLVIATKSPGDCKRCRHANQGTVDFGEGRLFCWIVKATKKSDQTCDVTVDLRSTQGGPTSTYHLFEGFDGDNATFDRSRDLRILAEDADAGMRRELHADRPFIPADE